MEYHKRVDKNSVFQRKNIDFAYFCRRKLDFGRFPGGPGLSVKYPPLMISEKSYFLNKATSKTCSFQIFAAGRGVGGAVFAHFGKKHYFTQKFADVHEKYAKLSFRIPDPPLR